MSNVTDGIISFLVARTTIFGDDEAAREIEEAETAHLTGAPSPLRMPPIAAPGAMLPTVIVTRDEGDGLVEKAVTAGRPVAILAATLAPPPDASATHGRIGSSGASVLSRVVRIMFASIAVDAFLGVSDVLGISKVAPAPGDGLLEGGL